jgi:hypothetical protein
MATEKQPKSFRLSDEAIVMLDRLSGYHGVSQTAVVEMAVRQMARRDLGESAAAAPPPVKGKGKK